MKYYFTFSIDDGGGWCEVTAESYNMAIRAFSLYHPDRGGFVACAGVYDENEFGTTIMGKTGRNAGKGCIERIVLKQEVVE